MTFADRLCEKMKEKKLQNKDVAFECSTSAWSVSQWRNGHVKPDAERLKILADFLGVTEAYLIYGKTEVVAEEKAEEEDDTRRNGSGYFDQTAFLAMKNMERKKTMEINKGEIWEVQVSNGTALDVVLNVHEKHCNIITLLPQNSNEHDYVCVIAKGLKYTDPALVSYKMKSGFIAYVKTMKEFDFENLLRKVRKSLGFADEIQKIEDSAVNADVMIDEQTKAENESLKFELEETKKLADHFKDECRILQIQKQTLEATSSMSEEVRISLAKVEAERDLYKQFYEQLFERVVAK